MFWGSTFMLFEKIFSKKYQNIFLRKYSYIIQQEHIKLIKSESDTKCYKRFVFQIGKGLF